MRATPFDPPEFAGVESQQAYAHLKSLCDGPASGDMDVDRIVSLITPTYYSLMDFVEVQMERDLCQTLADLHWWEVHGDNVTAMGWTAAGITVAFVLLWLLWARRRAVASTAGGAAISGLAVGLKAKRSAERGLKDLGRRVREKADRDSNNSN